MMVIRVLIIIVAIGQVLLQVGYFITSSPELLPNKKYNVEVNNKKPKRYSSAVAKVQRCKPPKCQRPALLAQNPMLAIVILSCWSVANSFCVPTISNWQY